MSNETIKISDEPRIYPVFVTKEAKQDVLQTRQYILDNFKYRSIAEEFIRTIDKMISGLTIFPRSGKITGFEVDGKAIYYKLYRSYMLFYLVEEEKVIVLRVLKDRMYWQAIIKRLKDFSV